MHKPINNSVFLGYYYHNLKHNVWDYKKYLEFHLKHCERFEHLGNSRYICFGIISYFRDYNKDNYVFGLCTWVLNQTGIYRL